RGQLVEVGHLEHLRKALDGSVGGRIDVERLLLLDQARIGAGGAPGAGGHGHHRTSHDPHEHGQHQPGAQVGAQVASSTEEDGGHGGGGSEAASERAARMARATSVSVGPYPEEVAKTDESVTTRLGTSWRRPKRSTTEDAR